MIVGPEQVGRGRRAILVCVLSALPLLAGIIALQTAADAQNPRTTADSQNDVVIENLDLPEAYPRAHYEVRLHARGGVPVLQWHFVRGTLPAGIEFTEDGLLHGTTTRVGDYRFAVQVMDGANPRHWAEKEFVLRVVSAMSLKWRSLAHVSGNRIDGMVTVSNTTPDDIDLTFDAKAVAEDGRATEIGYQHFPLRRGTVDMEISFGETLPRGAYKVYVLAVGEVVPKKLIYREELPSPAALQVTVGP